MIPARVKIILAGGLLIAWAILASGCAAGGGEYGYDTGASVGVGFDYYDGYGGDYGGWGPGYRVGPRRDHGEDRDHRPNPSGGANRGRPSGNHSYHAPPAGRSAPSIPSRGHGGGRGH